MSNESALHLHEMEHEAFSAKYIECENMVLRDLLHQADAVMKCLNPLDVLVLAMDHPAIQHLMPVHPNAADMAFAIKDFPACIEGYVQDTTRDMVES